MGSCGTVGSEAPSKLVSGLLPMPADLLPMPVAKIPKEVTKYSTQWSNLGGTDSQVTQNLVMDSVVMESVELSGGKGNGKDPPGVAKGGSQASPGTSPTKGGEATASALS